MKTTVSQRKIMITAWSILRDHLLKAYARMTIPLEIMRKAEIAAEKDNRIVVDDRREKRERQVIPRKRHGQLSKLPPKVTN
jgi:hypothetical protein